MKLSECDDLRDKLGFEGMLVKDYEDRSGGLILFWKSYLSVDIQSFFLWAYGYRCIT